ncbi:MAG TPA: 50S ribosomal protein L25/general stress protein Ctc [Rhodanobacteraceae bacterium]
MASKHKITAARRTDAGKGASRRLRRAGKVPAVIYGNNIPPVNLELDHEEVLLASRHEWFFSSVLDLEVEGQTQPVLIRDWQVHPYKQQMLHMDIFRIDENAQLRVTVPIHFLNQDTSPAGKASGVAISHNLTEVEVACLPKDLPEHLEVDLGALELGDLIHLSDIKLPAGVELPALKLGEEHNIAVAGAHAIKVEAEPEAEEVAAAEPAADAGEAPKDADK